jgi:hypothetical protein
MAKKVIKGKNTAKTAAVADDQGAGMYGLAKAIEGVADEIRPLYHIEQMGDYVGDLASAVNNLANATALSVIAQHGSTEDRAAVVERLKGWFEDFGK